MRRKGETYKVEHQGVTFTVEREARAIMVKRTKAEMKDLGFHTASGPGLDMKLVDYEPLPPRSADPSLVRWAQSLKGLVTEAGVRIAFNDKGEAFAMTSIEVRGGRVHVCSGDSFTVNIYGETFCCERRVKVGDPIAPVLRKAKRALAKAEAQSNKWDDEGISINREDY